MARRDERARGGRRAGNEFGGTRDVRAQSRSGCPINLTVELLGDRWSLLVLRDVMFADRHFFRELLEASDEGIASNILADRLRRLTDAGLLSRSDVAGHKQKVRYELTEKGIQLLPLLVQIGIWGSTHLPADPELAAYSLALGDGGPAALEEAMQRLRERLPAQRLRQSSG